MIEIELDDREMRQLLQDMIDALDHDLEARLWNPVEYVPKLEFGSSKQAPYGMVRVSIPEIRNVMGRMLGSVNFFEAARQGRLRETLAERLNMAADFAHGLIRDRTPIRTGNARRHWFVDEAS